MPDAVPRRYLRVHGDAAVASTSTSSELAKPIEYYGELVERRREVVLLGRPAWVLGPEDLAVLKMMFYRRKDLADVESLLREGSGALDLEFVRAKLAALEAARLAPLHRTHIPMSTVDASV